MLVRDAVYAVAYRAYAIRPYNFRKTNTAKIIFDVGKTMSYVEKIMSDIIQTTSDLFLSTCNLLKNKCLYDSFIKQTICYKSICCAKTQG